MPDGPTDDTPKKSFRQRLARLIAGQAEEPVAPEKARGPDASAAAMRFRAQEFETASVRDVMLARTEIGAIEVEATLGEVLDLFASSAHSRMPVYRETLDEPVGFVHIKDVVAELAKARWSSDALAQKPLETLVRKILFVAESERLPDLLVKMQQSRIHLALVVDEYGGIDGMVSLEDLVEQIVGDIEDEHDVAPPPILRRARNVWEVDGLAQIVDVERETRLHLAVEAHEADIETLGGLAAALAGRVPEAGVVIEHPLGHRLEIVASDPRRVLRLRVKAAGKQPGQPPGALAKGSGSGQETAQAYARAGKASRDTP
jgi:CBS domain containing-hemolysin-like protein